MLQVLCIYPNLIHPWPVSGIALWLGLVQDVLIPIGLGIVDSRFCKWVSNVYRCSTKKIEEKLPHVGLDGKFRPFGSTGQPQSLEINQDRNVRAFQSVEHRFPITNGSLYTSIDGRLPVIHNYRRNKDQRGGPKAQEKQSSNVALHSSHLSRQVEFSDNPPKMFPSCGNCQADQCPSHSNLHHLSPHYINEQLNLLQLARNVHQQPLANHNPLALARATQSQESLNYLGVKNDLGRFFSGSSEANLRADSTQPQCVRNNSRNLVRLNRLRLSRSEDSLTGLQREFGNKPRPTPTKPASAAPADSNKPKNYRTKININVPNAYSSSDEDYLTDVTVTHVNDAFDSLSSKSGYSITTEANCDFEFFQSRERSATSASQTDLRNAKDGYYLLENRPLYHSEDFLASKAGSQTDLNKNFRITRSNSKRSLENFRAFIQNEEADLRNNNSPVKTTLQRSSSYMTLEDRQNLKQNKHVLRSDSNLLERFGEVRQKVKSIEYLPGSNASTIFVEDLGGYFGDGRGKYVGSVPDLKKVFISEYI
ncbi:hypothetical protein NQ318_001932 [Aromia moschata]|uniref:Uncharacterized protein n=1 Tax=Aromia moschata TaxID=1265417 RepID=A0AAV8Z1Z1_9CUCU|nr:hypothetical protein NQ318_001932 [Aromia moschata]